MSTNDVNRELARRIAGAFNSVEPSADDIDEVMMIFYTADKEDRIKKLRGKGWIVCPPLVGITAYHELPITEEVKVGGTCSD